MKFKINAKAFREEVAEAAAFTQNGIGVDGCVCLVLEDGTLSIRSKSQKSGYTGSLAVSGKDNGTAIVRNDKLNMILASLPDKETEFTLKDDDFIIKQDKIRFKLKSRTEVDHFTLDAPESWQAVPAFFADAVERTAYATSKDFTKIQFSGIYIDVVDGKMNLVATDGRRLSIVSEKFDGENSSILIPSWFMIQMSKRKVTGYAVKGNVVWFKAGDKYYSSALINKEFPSYQRVIPVQTDYSTISVPRDIFADSISRISLVCDKNTRKIKVDVKDGRMKITGSSNEGTATEEMEVQATEGTDASFFVSSKYIADAIGCTKAKNISLSFKTNLAPLVIKDDECRTWSAVVMPMNGD